MKKIALLGSCALVAATASTSFAGEYYPANHWRCSADQLYGHPSYQASYPEQRQGYGRTTWARDAYKYFRYGTGANTFLATKFWKSWMDDEVEAAAAPAYDLDLYPVYADDNNATTGIWKGPGPQSTATWYGTTFSTIKSRPWSLPKSDGSVYADALCEAGCYSPEQEVRFGDGFMPVAQAFELGEQHVTTLTPKATLGSLSFMDNDIARWTVDIAPANQAILTIRMQSGGELRVTAEHPVLTSEGVMKKASDLVVGESLVREDGSPDPIASTERKMVFTKVYNLRPTTTDLLSNIVVAQGYLNGSARYQSEYLKYLNRRLMRSNVPMDVIPRTGATSAQRQPSTSAPIAPLQTAPAPRRR